MTRICYVDKNFASGSLAIIAKAADRWADVVEFLEAS